MVGYVLFSLGIGGAAGILWELVVDLPGYRVGNDGAASTNERGLTEFIAADAWFVVLGLGLGALLGLVAWRLFRSVGWPVVPLALVAAVLAAVACWAVGHQLGPGPFEPRLAAARPGEFVPIDLTLRAKASLVVWPLAAVIPILIGSSLGRDDEEPSPLFSRRAG